MLLTVALMLLMAASPAWAAPGGSDIGYGKGTGAGESAHIDHGKHVANGGGRFTNNPHCNIFC